MENLNDLKTQEKTLTSRLEMLSDKLASDNLEPDSKAILVKKYEEALQERIQIRKQIQEL